MWALLVWAIIRKRNVVSTCPTTKAPIGKALGSSVSRHCQNHECFGTAYAQATLLIFCPGMRGTAELVGVFVARASLTMNGKCLHGSPYTVLQEVAVL